MPEVVHKIVLKGNAISGTVSRNYKFVSVPRIGDNIRLLNGDSIEITSVIWETLEPEAIMAVTLISHVRHVPESYFREAGYV